MTLNLVNHATNTTVTRTVPVFVPATAGAAPPNKKSIAKVNELGTLFATIAGMMNVIAMIDAAFPSSRRKSGDTVVAGVGTSVTDRKDPKKQVQG